MRLTVLFILPPTLTPSKHFNLIRTLQISLKVFFSVAIRNFETLKYKPMKLIERGHAF